VFVRTLIRALPAFRTAWGAVLLGLVLGPPAAPASSSETPSDAGPGRGRRGHGLTVYRGTIPKRFEVEILGRLEKSGSRGDLILGRLSGAPLEETGVLQGMSGSPVWVDGKLVGAVAATWPFASEPVAMIRPIVEMRRLDRYLREGGHPTWSLGQLSAPAPQALGLPPGLEEGMVQTDWTGPALVAELWRSGDNGGGYGNAGRSAAAAEGTGRQDPAGPRNPPPGAARFLEEPLELGRGLVWSAAGLDHGVEGALGRWVGSPVVPALTPEAAPPTARVSSSPEAALRSSSDALQAGDAVAVVLIRGDALLAATGTVTENRDGTILAFGHPFLGSGPVSLPLYRAEVLGWMPSRQVSFKFAQPTTEAGAMLVDSPVGIAGRIGVRADVLPVEVVVQDHGGSRNFHFEVARHPTLTAPLVYWCVQNSLMVGQDLSTVATARLDLVLELEDQPPLRTRVALTGLQIGGNLASEVMLPLNLLAFNAGHTVRVERVKATLDLRGEIQSAQLGRVRIRPATVRAGDRVHLSVELLPYRAAPVWVELELDLPAALADGKYLLHLSDGGRAFATEMQRAKARWSYPGLRPIREAFAQRRSPETLVAVLYGRSNGAVVRGSEWQQLPPSVQGVLGRTRGKGPAEAVAAEILARAETVTSWILDGERVLDLRVGKPPRDEAVSRRP